MADEVQKHNVSDVDKDVDEGLVAMFLKMSPEERLRANDNAAGAILELRHAFKQRKHHQRGSKSDT